MSGIERYPMVYTLYVLSHVVTCLCAPTPSATHQAATRRVDVFERVIVLFRHRRCSSRRRWCPLHRAGVPTARRELSFAPRGR